MEESTNSPSSSEQSSDNVIPFPGRQQLRLIAVEEQDEQANRELVDEFVQQTAIELLSQLHVENFDIQSRIFDKNFGFAVEALRSALYGTFSIEHPFQEIVDKCVKFVHDNDDDEEPA